MLILSPNLKQRIISASLLAPLILMIIYSGGIAFTILIILMTILMSYEWKDLIAHHHADTPPVLWQIAGIAYIALPTSALLWLRGLDNGLLLTFWLLLAVWATDIAAYFAGRMIGGWKLAPSISPNKTWAGLAGGIAGAAVIGAFIALLGDSPRPFLLMLVSGCLAVVAQMGDLLESGMKRYFGVKDSGQLLPGHGGILDRVDGIITAAPLVALIVLLENGNLFNG